MRSRAAVFIFVILLCIPVSANNDDTAEEMIPPPLDLDVRGTSLLWAGSPNKQAVALTFDDGPIPGKTEQLLRILKEHQVYATFFVVGSKASEHPELIQKFIDEGHEVGNHTHSHRNLTKAGSKEVLSEIKLCQEAVHKAVGFRPTLFRPPYGSANMTTLSVLSHLGLSAVFWSIDTRDWAAKDSSSVTSAVLDHVQNGDVILFHEHSSKTITALPGIIDELQKRGFVCETVSQLFDRQPAGPAGAAAVVASAKQSIRLPVKNAPAETSPKSSAPERPVPEFVDMAPPEPEVAVAAKPAEESPVAEGYATPEPVAPPAVVAAALPPPPPGLLQPNPTIEEKEIKALQPVLPAVTATTTATTTATATEIPLPSPTATPTETSTATVTMTSTFTPTETGTPLPTASPTLSPTATSTIPPTETVTPTATSTLPLPTSTPSATPTETPLELPTSIPVVVKAPSATPAGHPAPATKALPLAKVSTSLTELAPVTVKPERAASPLQPRVNVEGPGALAPAPSQGKPIAPIPAIPSSPTARTTMPETHANEPAVSSQSIPGLLTQPSGLHTLPSPPASIEPVEGDASPNKRVRRLTPVNRFKDTGTATAEGKGVRRSRVLTPVQENGQPHEDPSWGYSEQPGT